ncbi:hypothetical protein [Telmatospirillum sp. J64-1]|uniref:hypothetical protein n=1 Tax=Telmatospirillum sp. J64-1 TaxID=2502183 RepID=UPI00115C6905|nr:hypothetical protein [Telmatospirillum sp. J64-1]
MDKIIKVPLFQNRLADEWLAIPNANPDLRARIEITGTTGEDISTSRRMHAMAPPGPQYLFQKGTNG